LAMGALTGGTASSSAQAITPDGSVIVGYGFADLGYEAWRWEAATGMVSIGDLPGGSHFAVANAVTPDGRVIVGQSSSAASGNGAEAFRWTSTYGMVALGD